MKRRITDEGDNKARTGNKNLIFENNAPFRSCILKIYNTFIDSAKNIVMPMYNLVEYSDNYSMTLGSLLNYYRDEVNDDTNKNNAASNKINNNKTITSKSSEYKTKLIGSTPADKNTLDTKVVVPLKYLSNFEGFLDLSLINCKIQLETPWSNE